ncbi:hypothetical protein OQA88_8323 [Cercophora sp. LCS_1]
MTRLSKLTTFLALLSPALTSTENDQQPLSDLSSDQTTSLENYECTHPPYKIHIISRSPLLLYLPSFLTPSERSHLLSITSSSFTRSSVASQSGHAQNTHRTSQSTLVPRDPIVRCIETRALLFQGFDTPRANLEPLQLVKYGPTEHYHYHTDWFTDPAHAAAATGGNRISSFFAYVSVANDTTGGGTNFPHVDAPTDTRWCDEGWVDCDEEWERGVTFRPVEGNAIYWENMVDGVGDERTLHAGLPLTGGGKVGMNIWTREGGLNEEVRGVDKYP